MKDSCKTKYPIVLVHGTNCRDFRPLHYWGRIPESLQENGAIIFYGGQDAGGTIKTNAIILKRNIMNAIRNGNYKKVNIIAHSKGGLEVRYMIHELNMEKYTASLTTISTPHYGSKTIDKTCRIPSFLYKIVSNIFNLYYHLIGDNEPNFYDAIRELRTTSCRIFNEIIINSPNVYYQSYTSAMKNPFSDLYLMIPNLIINIFEGENDGLVAVESTKWGSFMGVLRGDYNRGISHFDIVDFRRKKISNLDIRDFYIKIVNDLKNKGL